MSKPKYKRPVGRPRRLSDADILFLSAQILGGGGSHKLTKESFTRLAGYTPQHTGIFASIVTWRDAAWREAVRLGNTRAVAWGLCEKNTHCRNAPLALKIKAVGELLR